MCAPPVPGTPWSPFGRSPAHSSHLHRPTRSRLPAHTPPALNALLSTGQGASAFNEALSFDTASVTTMESMFHVRSARAPNPMIALQTLDGPLLAPQPPHTLAPPSPRATDIVCPPFGWAGRV